jgi:16S rRNA (guanine966-N2)-methyltransferase
VRWMELLAPHLPDARVLELYAGTGAVGLEAVSRGARSADFVENNPAALHSLKANIATVRARDRTRVFKRDALRWADRLEPDSYEVVFADPPYGSRQSDRLVERWLRRPYSAVLTLEHAANHALPPGGESHPFGDSRITVYTA